MRPTLSICIPTYNRAHYLRDTLESIASQLTPDITSDIEVVISDNASTDDTQAIVTQFGTRIPLLTYHHNEQNLGFDANCYTVITEASGIYCWYVGDDDILAHGALKEMHERCTEGTYAIIATGCAPLTDRTALKTLPTYHPDPTTYHISSDPNEAYARNYYPSALPLLAFRRDDYLAHADFSHHTPGWFYFEALLMQAAKATLPSLFIDAPLVYTGPDVRWAESGEGLRIFIDCNRFLARMPEWGYDTARVENEIKNNRKHFLRVLIAAKSRGLPVRSATYELMRDYLRTLPSIQRMLALLLYILPNALFQLAHSIKRRVL